MFMNELSPPPAAPTLPSAREEASAPATARPAVGGHKGQKARSGGGVRIGFEGGQMPLARRIPKRGFNNIFAKPLESINVSALNHFEDGAIVDANVLLAEGILSKCVHGVKILGSGESSPRSSPSRPVPSRPAPRRRSKPLEERPRWCKVVQTFRNAWKIPELRRKILFTLFIVLLYRLGNAVPVPYVDTNILATYFAQLKNTVLGLYNTMSGGAFSLATIFALSIQPYINASIIIQLLCIAIPALERLSKEGGEEGKKKIAAITRYSTVGIGLLQGYGYYLLMSRNGIIVSEAPAVWAAIVIVMTFTAGSALVMWLGEQITEFGIGNGISIILFASIVSRFPAGPWQPRQQSDQPRPLLGRHDPHADRSSRHDRDDRHRQRCRAPDPGAVRQAGSWPQDVRRSGHVPADEGQHVRRAAHHLRAVHRVPAPPRSSCSAAAARTAGSCARLTATRSPTRSCTSC